MSPSTTDLGSPRSDPQKTRVLLEAALRGDEACWERLFSAHSGFLRHVLHARRAQSAGVDVEEVLQDTLCRAWSNMKSFEYRGVGSLRRWLQRIAENSFVDHLRTRPDPSTGQVDALADGHHADPEEQAQERELTAKLYASLARLQPSDRDIVIMRKLEGLTWEEICEIEGRPRTSVRRAYEQALNRLQAWMG